MPHPHGQEDLGELGSYRFRHTRHQPGDRFGRMFPEAAPLFTDPRVLADLGRAGGPMDGGANPPKTATVPVGDIFFGQFVDHDITFDVASSFETVNVPGTIPNTRTPTLDLDCVYGQGPDAMPFLFERGGDFGGVKLITGAQTGRQPGVPNDPALWTNDLPRVLGAALIGDPRNDENRIISQIQLGMIRAHNRFAADLRAAWVAQGRPFGQKELFEAARQLTTWHYQWNVVNVLLADICGAGTVNRVLGQGRTWYRPDIPFIPVEFSVAAYRFGHSMVATRVQTQNGGEKHGLFEAVLGAGFSPLADARAIVDMHEVFHTHAARPVQKAERLDTRLSPALLALPPNVVGASEASLATRNLIRGQSFLLPSGETVARIMAQPATEIAQVTARAKAMSANRLGAGTPLWLYILAEAEIVGREAADGSHEPGEGLGPVGATIVAEVIVGLIELDPRSWLGANRNWRPQTDIDPAKTLTSIGALLAYGA